MIRSSLPVLGVQDVLKTAAYFRDVLGFQALSVVGDPPAFAIVERDTFEVFIQRVPHARPADPHAWSIYLHCADAAALKAEVTARGAALNSDLIDKIYGQREFEIAGPENLIIVFGQPIARAD